MAVTAGELSPIVNGFVYCGVITGCQAAYEPRRAQEWTAALTRWCAEQPDIVELQRHVPRAPGRDHAAARRVAGRARRRRGAPPSGCALAANRVGGRRRRTTGAARSIACAGSPPRPRQAYATRAAAATSRSPGWRCCGSTQGNGDAAAAAIRRALGETTDRAAARRAAARLRRDHARGRRRRRRRARRATSSARSPSSWQGDLLGAMARTRAGRSSSPRATPARRIVSLRRAAEAWRALAAPYEAARARVLVGLACRALGDDDTAGLELAAARDAFARARRRAGPRPRRRARRTRPRRATRTGLTPRELEVLRWSRPAGATGRSPRSSSSASTPSPATCRTCSPSSACRRARRPRRRVRARAALTRAHGQE